MNDMARLIAIVAICMAASSVTAADKDAWYVKAVKKLEVTFEPAQAKPGETVTLKLLVHLNDGYYTYPLKQLDKNAAGMVNKLAFADGTGLIFVGETKDPIDFDTKAEPELGIKEMRIYRNEVIYERKAVVSPKAKPGEIAIALKSFRLNVCDKLNCYPTKTVMPEGKFKVLEGPATPVAKEFQDEVRKALDDK